MTVNLPFVNTDRVFKTGEVWMVSDNTEKWLSEGFEIQAIQAKNQKLRNTVKFSDISNFMNKATIKGGFKNLLIIRTGGIGDLIALSSVIDYIIDEMPQVKIHLATQYKYLSIFEWFTNKPNLKIIEASIFNDYTKANQIKKYNNWARFYGEGLIENGYKQNWFELFFNQLGADIETIDKSYFRPELIDERINDIESNIQELSNGKSSLLICNKASAMMRTINAADIYNALPEDVKYSYQIFAYGYNLSELDKKELKDKITIIESTDLDGFLRDCFDANMVISVDTGALHFREGIGKKAIGLYNSFSTESRTKYYESTKSFDIKSDCKLMPCFSHETHAKHSCNKGNDSMFAAPCFDSRKNKTLHNQLVKIFTNNI